MSDQEKRTRATFAQHNVPLEAVGAKEFIGDDPFAKPGHGIKKFSVNRLNGLWSGMSTGLSGNIPKFFELKSKANEMRFRGTVAQTLATQRSLPIRALRAWRVGWDGRQYTIPADACGKTYDLRRYSIGGKTQSTSGAHASLSGITVSNSEIVYLAEGEWDGIAVWEMLQAAIERGGEPPAIPASVYSAPGATTFPSHAVDLFRDKKVRVLYDADEAGMRGTLRIQRLLNGIAREITYINWPEGLPDGYDVRDLYKEKGAETAWTTIHSLLKPTCPGGSGGAPDGAPPIAEELAKLVGPGLAPEEVLKQYRKYLYLPNPEVLDVLYGSVFANRLDGDPLWLFLVAPPGGTKTELIMSLADGPLIRTISSLTPRTLVSGAVSSNPHISDPSLLPQLNGRVLGIKDFTTILAMPQQTRDEIFGILREVYDGRFEKSWGTGISRRYDSKFGIIAGVTPVIEKFGSSASVLGERFLKYRIPRTTRLAADDSLIDAALANLNRETEMRAELQKTARAVLDRPLGEIPAFPKAFRTKFRKLAQWVASLRGVVSRERFSQQVEFKPMVEVGTRLAKQFAKLAQGIAIYRFRPEVDENIYQIILSVARGTIPDRVEEIIRYIYLRGAEGNPGKHIGLLDGCAVIDIAKGARLDAATVRLVLQDLELLRIVKKDVQKGPKGTKGTYTLAKALRLLMNDLDLYHKEERWMDARSQAAETPEEEAPADGARAYRRPARAPAPARV